MVDLSAHFEDPDGDALVYTATVSVPAVVETAVAGGELTVAARALGEAVVTVTALDAGGLTAEQGFTVTVPNRPPEATDAIPPAEMYVRDSLMVDLSAHFEDRDGDSLAYAADVSVPTVAEATVAGGELAVAGLAPGRAVVTVTARDPGALTAEQSFPLSILSRAGHLRVDFQHDTPDLGGLAVRIEASAIDSLQVAAGLSAYSAAIDGGVSVVLLGPIPLSGTLFSFWTDDATAVDDTTVRATEGVATTYEPRSLDGSSITVRR